VRTLQGDLTMAAISCVLGIIACLFLRRVLNGAWWKTGLALVGSTGAAYLFFEGLIRNV